MVRSSSELEPRAAPQTHRHRHRHRHRHTHATIAAVQFSSSCTGTGVYCSSSTLKRMSSAMASMRGTCARI